MSSIQSLVTTNTFGEWMYRINDLVTENNSATAIGSPNALVRFDLNNTLEFNHCNIETLTANASITIGAGPTVSNIATDMHLVDDSTLVTAKGIDDYVTTKFNSLIGGANTAYDTLKELENELKNNDNDIASILTSIGTKVNKPASSFVTASNEYLQWNGSSLTKSAINVRTNAEIEELISKSSGIGLKNQINIINADNSREASPEWIIFQTYLPNNSTDLTTALASGQNAATIFNNWRRFSHSTSGPNASELNAFVYDAANEHIDCTINTSTYVGFLSAKQFDDYELDVQLTAASGPAGADNDRMGLVIASTEDSGIDYTLSAIRNHDNNGVSWAIYYNYLQSSESTIIDGTSTVPHKVAQANWSTMPNGTSIRIRREGDIIKCWTTQDDETTIDTNTLLEIDLKSDLKLEKFRGKKSYGYACFSQGARFSNINFINYAQDKFEEYVFDISSTPVAVYKPQSDGTFTLEAGETLSSAIGPGRLVRDRLTGLLYYIDLDGSLINITSEGFQNIEFNKSILLGSKANVSYANDTTSGETGIDNSGSGLGPSVAHEHSLPILGGQIQDSVNIAAPWMYAHAIEDITSRNYLSNGILLSDQARTPSDQTVSPSHVGIFAGGDLTCTIGVSGLDMLTNPITGASTITADGDIKSMTGDILAAASDDRLKTVLSPIKDALDKIANLDTFAFAYNSTANDLGFDMNNHVGVSAQQLEKVMPELVRLAPVDDNGEGVSVSGENYLTVDYPKLSVLLLKAIQELKQEIDELKNK